MASNRARHVQAGLAALCLAAALPAHAQAPDPVIARAEASASANDPGVAADLGALFDALRASHDPLRQIALIDAVGRLGDRAGHASDAARAAVRAAAPGVLLAIIRSDADWSVRGEAMTCLRTIDAPDDIVAQAIEAGRAATGDHAGYLRARAVEMQTWRDTRANSSGTPATDDGESQRRARLYLGQHGIEVTYDALTDALGKGQPGTVASLLTAGLAVGGNAGARATRAVVNGLATACMPGADAVPSDGVAQSLSFLAGHGLPLNLADETGNTILMSAAQFCPAPVAARLLLLGADVDPVNKQQFTPLQMALVSGKWDVAQVLVDHGARITRKQADQIFFAPPQEQAQRDLLSRAIH